MEQCTCLFHHPQTEEERKKVVEMLEYSRRVNDPIGIMVTLAQLTGECKAKEIS